MTLVKETAVYDLDLHCWWLCTSCILLSRYQMWCTIRENAKQWCVVNKASLMSLHRLKWRDKTAHALRSSTPIFPENKVNLHFIEFWWVSFFLVFGGHKSFLWDHGYPSFGLLVMPPLGFKARVGSLSCTWQRRTFYTFTEIHLWCDTCQPLCGQHGNWAIFFHIPVSRHWWDSKLGSIIPSYFAESRSGILLLQYDRCN